jgi:hypothetical protein
MIYSREQLMAIAPAQQYQLLHQMQNANWRGQQPVGTPYAGGIRVEILSSKCGWDAQ